MDENIRAAMNSAFSNAEVIQELGGKLLTMVGLNENSGSADG